MSEPDPYRADADAPEPAYLIVTAYNGATQTRFANFVTRLRPDAWIALEMEAHKRWFAQAASPCGAATMANWASLANWASSVVLVNWMQISEDRFRELAELGQLSVHDKARHATNGR